MKRKNFEEVKNSWSEVARKNTSVNFSYELEVYKNMLNIFQAGDYYYYIFNCAKAEIEFKSELVKQVLGFKDADELSVEYLVNNMHPEDRPYFYEFELKVVEFLKTLDTDKLLKYKMSYDYRVKTKNGKYIRILQQSVTIQSDKNGAVIRVLGIHTDITHLNKNEPPSLSFIGMEGLPSYLDVTNQKQKTLVQNTSFTNREKEVLNHLLDGKTSKSIASLLNISKLTVDRHRKNLLKKTNANSTLGLTLLILNK